AWSANQRYRAARLAHLSAIVPPSSAAHVCNALRTWDGLALQGGRNALHLAVGCSNSEFVANGVAAVTAGHRMRAVLIIATIVLLVIAAAALAIGWEGALTRRQDPVTVDAYVQGDRTPLSSHLSGYVRTVLVRDNQLVRAGDTIVQM